MPRIFKAVLLSTLSTICLNAHAAKVPLEYSFDIGMSNITKNGESLTGFTLTRPPKLLFHAFYRTRPELHRYSIYLRRHLRRQ